MPAAEGGHDAVDAQRLSVECGAPLGLRASIDSEPLGVAQTETCTLFVLLWVAAHAAQQRQSLRRRVDMLGGGSKNGSCHPNQVQRRFGIAVARCRLGLLQEALPD